MRDIMLVLHFLGLVLGLGTGFGHMFLGMSAKKMTKEEAEKFVLQTLAINKMGVIGISLLVASGWFLMEPYWGTLTSSPFLIAKLVGVAILIFLVATMNGLAKKAIKVGGGEPLKKIENLGKITLPLGIIIVILAVLVFH